MAYALAMRHRLKLCLLSTIAATLAAGCPGEDNPVGGACGTGFDPATGRVDDFGATDAANKVDALDHPSRIEQLEKHVRNAGLPFHRISGVTGEGVDRLLEAAWREVAAVHLRQGSGGQVQPVPTR